MSMFYLYAAVLKQSAEQANKFGKNVALRSRCRGSL